MKKCAYRISGKAISDLEEIWYFTAKKWSMEQADSYYHLIIGEIEYISCNFMSGKSMDHIKYGYRAILVKSHVIFYRMDTHKMVEIVRILHQRMDMEERLNEE